MKNKILRIIDANLNRSLEGIRVVEDLFRFVYNDKERYLLLRRVRHKLTKIFKKYYIELLAHRESKTDVGRGAEESKYEDIDEVLSANLHRVMESLRVLEEMSKLVCIENVKNIKDLRYTVYEIERVITEKNKKEKNK